MVVAWSFLDSICHLACSLMYFEWDMDCTWCFFSYMHCSIYMRNFLYLCIMVWIHMDACEYICTMKMIWISYVCTCDALESPLVSKSGILVPIPIAKFLGNLGGNVKVSGYIKIIHDINFQSYHSFDTMLCKGFGFHHNFQTN